jgi:hypothetical protein
VHSPRVTARALLGLGLAALIVCFAPVIHALCVAAPTDATHTFSHVMPDGQTMVMGDPAAPTVAPSTAATRSTDDAVKADSIVFQSLLGVVLVAGGIALTLVACALACLRLVRSPLARERLIHNVWHPPPGRPRLTLSLHELSISRT